MQPQHMQQIKMFEYELKERRIRRNALNHHLLNNTCDLYKNNPTSLVNHYSELLKKHLHKKEITEEYCTS